MSNNKNKIDNRWSLLAVTEGTFLILTHDSWPNWRIKNDEWYAGTRYLCFLAWGFYVLSSSLVSKKESQRNFQRIYYRPQMCHVIQSGVFDRNAPCTLHRERCAQTGFPPHITTIQHTTDSPPSSLLFFFPDRKNASSSFQFILTTATTTPIIISSWQ